MFKLRLLSIATLLVIPLAALADPISADAREIQVDCGHELVCVAAKFADALTSSYAGRQALRLDSLITFKPGTARVYSRDREKLMALAATWQEHVRWTTITIEGYADSPNNPALALQRADKIRGYLIRYGVAADYVVAIDHPRMRADGPDHRDGGRVDLTIGFCSKTSDECRGEILAATAD